MTPDNRPSRCILLVEDEAKLAEAIAQGLRSQGYSIDLSSTGEDAMESLHKRAYDLILLDIMLPKKSGLEILRQMRMLGNNTRVLVLTSRDAIEDRVLGPGCRRRRLPREAVRLCRITGPGPCFESTQSCRHFFPAGVMRP